MRYDEQGKLLPISDREIVKHTRRWTIIGVVILLLLPAAVWGLSVLFSGPAGRGNQIKQINRAENRTFAQEQFHEMYENVAAYDAQLALAKANADQHRATYEGKPDNAIGTNANEQARLDSIYTGLTNQCISVSHQYNAEAEKISKRRFLDANLPDSLPDGPSTDCAPGGLR